MIPPIPVPDCLKQNGQFFMNFPKRKKLQDLKAIVISLSILFASVLEKHANNEFEIQIRSGEITGSSKDILIELNEDFKVLQYKERLNDIIQNCKKSVKNEIHRYPYIMELLNVVEDDLAGWFRDIIAVIHTKTMKTRRNLNMKLCDEKCSMGPTIYNFTETQLSPKLMKLLQRGLNEVPKIKTSETELLVDIRKEVIIAAKNLFFEHHGFYPRCSSYSVEESIISILSQCQSGSLIINELIALRDNFREKTPYFLSCIQSNNTMESKDLLKLIPKSCIISPSDKQVGISVLPYSWYIKEYESQVLKGGHQLINMSENQCLAMLHKTILQFRKGCSKYQESILIKLWPKTDDSKCRVGVLKLVPKVKLHKVNSTLTYLLHLGT